MVECTHAGSDSAKNGHLSGLVHALYSLGHWFPAHFEDETNYVTAASGALRCVTRERGDSICLVSVAGGIDCDNAQILDTALHASISRGRHVILYMSGVSSMDCAGVAVLVHAIAAARYRGLAFAIVAATREVDMALDLYQIRSLIPEFRHLADAKRLFCGAG